MKLNIGCGKKQLDGYINIDKEDFGQDFVCDVTKDKLPVKANSLDEVYATHFLEHIYPHEVEDLLNRLMKVLKKRGFLFFVVPHMNHERARVIQHKTFYTEATFQEIAKDWNLEMVDIVTNARDDIHCTMKKK